MNRASHGDFRVGLGEDAHRLAPGHSLVLGGVEVPDAPRGAVAHSDGDALLHAVADALLSTYALGDIGQHFPPGRKETAGLDSRAILRRAFDMVVEVAPEAHVVNCAAVVTLDEPKLGPHRGAIAASCAGLLGIPANRFGLTFKTSEGMAPDHVRAWATILLSARR